MSKEILHYVYILFDWYGAPFYVGKGSGGRMHRHERYSDKHNPLKNEIIEQTWIMLEEIPKVIIKETTSETEALELEMIFIKAIGRRDLGTGPLVNLTDGGDGKSGYIYPQYLRDMRSVQFKELRASEGLIKLRERAIKNGFIQSSEVLSERTRRQMAALSPEERSEMGKRGNEKLTPQQRTDRALKRESGMTPEARRDRSLKAAQKHTSEERSEIARKRQESKTPEERKESAIKGAVTRGLRGKFKPRKGIYKNCLTCGKEFYVKPKMANISKYCCYPCFAKRDDPRV